MTIYLVTGPRRYRDHDPGDRFEADLERDVEDRAVRVGAIRVLSRQRTTITPGSFRPPAGWPVIDNGRS